MKLSRNYIIVALALLALYLMFMRPQKSGFSWCFGGCSGWLPYGVANPKPSYFKYTKVSRSGVQVNYCHCN